MCNAWNHPPGCNCGWGGTSHGSVSVDINLASVMRGYQPPTILNTNDAKTYSTNCRWCGDQVFYHTNGYGDSVLFDSLGYPWEVHDCWQEYWNEQKAKRKILKPIILNKEQDINQQKRLILAGVLQQMRINSLSPTLTNVATQMGISEKCLKDEYGHLYQRYMDQSKKNVVIILK
jgi:hypothetical protein